MKCREYELYGVDEDYLPLNCPNCGAFLKWGSDKVECHKCHVELLVIPDVDEETGDELEWGKVCALDEEVES